MMMTKYMTASMHGRSFPSCYFVLSFGTGCMGSGVWQEGRPEWSWEGAYPRLDTTLYTHSHTLIHSHTLTLSPSITNHHTDRTSTPAPIDYFPFLVVRSIPGRPPAHPLTSKWNLSWKEPPVVHASLPQLLAHRGLLLLSFPNLQVTRASPAAGGGSKEASIIMMFLICPVGRAVSMDIADRYE